MRKLVGFSVEIAAVLWATWSCVVVDWVEKGVVREQACGRWGLRLRQMVKGGGGVGGVVGLCGLERGSIGCVGEGCVVGLN